MSVKTRKRFQVPEMEGRQARWYARTRGSATQMAEYRRQATRLTAELPSGGAVLEVAPGPGYQAIELARTGTLRVTGLDISHTMVEIAREGARAAGVSVDFRQGDVTAMPFESGVFDLIVCQAAFKNFKQPVKALDEMHRVLRPGGLAVIEDMNREAPDAAVAAEVRAMKLSRLNSFMTRLILAKFLRRRAYSPARFRSLVALSAFPGCEISTRGMALEVRLRKPGPA
jgi:ubiquinone/menaquinone biosynthesis C-methylase UbiE